MDVAEKKLEDVFLNIHTYLKKKLFATLLKQNNIWSWA